MFQISSFLNKFQENKGFSLLGVIIAMFIIFIGLVGILSLAHMSLKGFTLSKLRLIAAASGLGQEGIEIVRDIRNSHNDWSDWEWYNSAQTPTSTVGVYGVQYNSQCLNCCPNLGNPCPDAATVPLKLDSSSGLYQYNFGDNTSFYRKITLTKVSFRNVRVVAEIRWSIKGHQHYLTVEDELWNWK